MSADLRIYCHDCKTKTKSLGRHGREWTHGETWEILNKHIGHNIEFAEFAQNAKCKGTCHWGVKECEGDCYDEA
jgi:hypothetical protein